MSCKKWRTSDNLGMRFAHFAEQFIEIGYAVATSKYELYRKNLENCPMQGGEEYIAFKKDCLERIFSIDETMLSDLVKMDAHKENLIIPYNPNENEELDMFNAADEYTRKNVLMNRAMTQTRKESIDNGFSMMVGVNMKGELLASSYVRHHVQIGAWCSSQ